jgi:cytoskeleton protein RodZ
MNIGARLQASRERLGYSLADVAAALRIQPRYLVAIEHDDCSILPPRPYGRGFVRAYAAHLGENPEQTVRDFFAQFEPPAPVIPRVEPPPSRFTPMPAYERAQTGIFTVLLLCVGVAIVLAISIRRNPAPAAAPQHPVGTSGSGAPAVTGNTVPGQVHTTTDAPGTDGVAVDLEATAPAWVTATVDGKRTLYRTMQPGEHERLRGRALISITVGNAGAIRWAVNGRPAETMGAAGAVRSVRVSAD